LQAQFGRKYRVRRDPAECDEQSSAADAWLLQIPARYGHVFPYGGNRLAVSTHRRVEPRRRRQLSPEHKAKLGEAARPFWFGHGSGSHGDERQGTQRVLVDV
jgi:hypothetical protein